MNDFWILKNGLVGKGGISPLLGYQTGKELLVQKEKKSPSIVTEKQMYGF